jgi:hypothetical protein
VSHGSDVPESASEHIRNALQILAQPHDQLGALEFDAIRVRLARALALVDAESCGSATRCTVADRDCKP